MMTNIVLCALLSIPAVTAHGRIAVMTGDSGGNTTALGIQGGLVPKTGPNSVTEVDTTLFSGVNPKIDGLGHTSVGPNTLSDISTVLEQSGLVLPQVSATGGYISGMIHIVTSDGAGPYTAICDPTATGTFSTGYNMTVTRQVAGDNGNVVNEANANAATTKSATKYHWRRFLSSSLSSVLPRGMISKRATNVNENHYFSAMMPPGITCNGTLAGMSQICLIKIVNPSANGPFGGVIAVQATNHSVVHF